MRSTSLALPVLTYESCKAITKIHLYWERQGLTTE